MNSDELRSRPALDPEVREKGDYLQNFHTPSALQDECEADTIHENSHVGVTIEDSLRHTGGSGKW